MKKILIPSLIALLGLNGYYINKISLLNSQLNKLQSTIENVTEINNKSQEIKDINKLIFESNYKDDLVFNQISNNTAIILGFIAIIIAVIGLIGFSKFQEYQTKLRKIEDKIDSINRPAKMWVENTKYEILGFIIDFSSDLRKISKNEKLNKKLLIQETSTLTRQIKYIIQSTHELKIKELTSPLLDLQGIHLLQLLNEIVNNDKTTYQELTNIKDELYEIKLLKHISKEERDFLQDCLKKIESFPARIQ